MDCQYTPKNISDPYQNSLKQRNFAKFKHHF